jgi:hypothetical protein
MMGSGFKNCIAIAAAITATCFSLTASATVWNITDVQTGSQGNFGFSQLHKATISSPMSGSKLANIVNTGSFGQYNDGTGELTATFGLAGIGIGSGSTMSIITQIADPLIFNGPNGTNGATALLDVVFNVNFTSGIIPELATDTTFIIAAGFVCCGNNGDDPNTFHDNGSGGKVMTLWGANDLYLANPLGIDIRLTLDPTSVPEPMSGVIFGIGLVGCAYLRRRKTVSM